MTLKSEGFVSYEPCVTGKNVQTVDGTLLEEAGVGSMYVVPIGLLSKVLHVPTLFVNLV